MRKILIVIGLFLSISANAQIMGMDVLNLGTKTTIEMNAIPSNKIQEGSYVDNSDTGTLWRYNGVSWVDITGGTGNFVTLDNSTNIIDTGSDVWGVDMTRLGITNTVRFLTGQTLLEAYRTDLTAAARVFVNSTGNVLISVDDGTAKQFLFDGVFDGNTDVVTKLDLDNAIAAGNYSLETDTTPQLIAALDANGQSINSANIVGAVRVNVEDVFATDVIEGQSLQINGLSGGGTQNIGVDNNGVFIPVAGGSLTTDQTNKIANINLPPLNVVTAAGTIVLNDLLYVSGTEIGRNKIITNDTGTKQYVVDNSLPLASVARFETFGTAVTEIVPDTGVSIEYEGKTTLDGVTMSGAYNLGFLTKKANNTYVFKGESFSGLAGNDAIEALSPIHYWKPESIVASGSTDGSAVTGWDDTIATLDGTVVGAVTLNLDGSQNETQYEGGYIDFPDVPSVDFVNGTDSYSIVVKSGSIIGDNGYFYSKNDGASPQFGLYITGGNLSTVNGVQGGSIQVANTAVENSTYIVNVNAVTLDVWVDGVKVIDAAIVGTLQSPNQSLNFGGRTDGSFLFNGSLERVAIFNKELTDAEIAAINLEF